MAHLPTPSDQPLGGRLYPRIPHLPRSRFSQGDHRLNAAQARRATVQARPGDQLWIQDKLDGSNVTVARIGSEIVALTRAGFRAGSSRRLQARLFGLWVQHHTERFLDLLQPGERVVGEWLYQAHGTYYTLKHEPFVAFDLMIGDERLPYQAFQARLGGALTTPRLLETRPREPLELFEQLKAAQEPFEGFVYRVERLCQPMLIAKWVRPDYGTGRYFEDGEAVLLNVLRPEDAALLAKLARQLI